LARKVDIKGRVREATSHRGHQVRQRAVVVAGRLRGVSPESAQSELSGATPTAVPALRLVAGVGTFVGGLLVGGRLAKGRYRRRARRAEAKAGASGWRLAVVALPTLGRKLAGLTAFAAACYAVVLRRRLVRSGASDEEVDRPYPGADLIPDGKRASTMAVSIDAPPAQVWPWLVQMGWDRAGWYSLDRLDNGGRPSANEIHPDWQTLMIGDHLTAWSPRGPIDAWEVAALEPERFLGLRGLMDLRGRMLDSTQPRPRCYMDGLWGFQLEELPEDRTRLVVSGYQSVRPRLLERLLTYWFYPPVHWALQTRQFATLKRNIMKQSEKVVQIPTESDDGKVAESDEALSDPHPVVGP
jgi:proline iminopeptidase